MTSKDGKDKNEENATLAGNIGRVIDYMFNPSEEKIREMTVVSRLQASIFPLLDMKAMGLSYLVSVTDYRIKKAKEIQLRKDKDKETEAEKKLVLPEQPDLTHEFILRTAQWQKSIGGKNLEKAADLAMAEIEAQADNDPDLKGVDYDD